MQKHNKMSFVFIFTFSLLFFLLLSSAQQQWQWASDICRSADCHHFFLFLSFFLLFFSFLLSFTFLGTKGSSSYWYGTHKQTNVTRSIHIHQNFFARFFSFFFCENLSISPSKWHRYARFFFLAAKKKPDFRCPSPRKALSRMTNSGRDRGVSFLSFLFSPPAIFS